jgi:hypothetical protein
MEPVIYILSGILLFFFLRSLMVLVDAFRLAVFFKDNLDGLPKELPKHIQNLKEELGDETFLDLYESVKKGASGD